MAKQKDDALDYAREFILERIQRNQKIIDTAITKSARDKARRDNVVLRELVDELA